MHEPTAVLTRDELLAELARQGVRVSDHQLIRWQKAKLLPHLPARHLGHGRGTESQYPAEAIGVVRAILGRLDEGDSLTGVAVHFWWTGQFASSDAMRAVLRAHVKKCAAMRATAAKRRKDDDAMDDAAAAVERWHRQHRRWGAFQSMRKRAGVSGLAMLSFLLEEISLGLHRPSGDEERAAIALQFLGLPQSLTTPKQLAAVFPMLSKIMHPTHLAGVLAGVSEDRLAALPTDFRKLNAIAQAFVAWQLALSEQAKIADAVSEVLVHADAPDLHIVLTLLAIEKEFGIDFDALLVEASEHLAGEDTSHKRLS